MIRKIMSSKWADESKHPVVAFVIIMLLTAVLATPFILALFWVADNNPWYSP
jgi:hypothetical protein